MNRAGHRRTREDSGTPDHRPERPPTTPEGPMNSVVEIRREDMAHAVAEWQRVSRWRLRRRRALWWDVEVMAAELERLILRDGDRKT